MFTGLIQEKGRVVRLTPSAGGLRILVEAARISNGAEIGDSVSVNGACLTAVTISPPILEFDAVRETVERTTLSTLKPRDYVNLEPSLRAGDKMGGHMVLGHVDDKGNILNIAKSGSQTTIRVGTLPEIMRYIVEKGSIAIDGVSLTIAEVGPTWFTVAVIPHTLANTNLAEITVGKTVNLETDIIGKYVFKYMGKSASSDEGLLEKLSSSGFLE